MEYQIDVLQPDVEYLIDNTTAIAKRKMDKKLEEEKKYLKVPNEIHNHSPNIVN